MRSIHEARAMPYLQLDVPDRYPIDVKRNLARRLGEIYSRLLQTSPDMVTVAFREMDEGGVWRCSDGEPEPAALARSLIEACTESLGLRSDRLGVEFTQHTGDEMYRAERGFAANWTPAEGRMP
jgi:phenylpyruvate tautomerase PptA (4-oxalocrotonate tautomerase family)